MNSIINSYKNVIKDFSLNILASFVITAVTQIIVYPWLARGYEAALYGVILTIMGVGNTIVSTVGGSVSNTRLLMESEYEEKHKAGDFLPILFFLELLSAALFYVYIRATDTYIGRETVSLLILYLILGNARGYGAVAYRLELNFKRNLICSIAVAVGNIAGVAIIYKSGYSSLWPLIFLLGELFGIIVILSNSHIFREKFAITQIISKTAWKTAILLITTLMANILIYLDRMLLLPILGGEAVATYTTAAFFGKCLGLLLTPMASVLLSYFAQSDYNMTKSKYRKINISVIGFAAVFLAISLIASRWITGLLYPTLIDGSEPFLLIANLTMIIASVGNMTQPAVLKYAPTSFQIVIQAAYCVIYLGGGYYGSMHNGLWGFSIAALIAAIVRMVMLYLLGEIYIKDEVAQTKR